MHPDQKYIDAILTNNIVLLDELYNKVSGKIKHLVLQNNGCETDAADLLQDALLSIFTKASGGNFSLTCPIEAFLYIICRKNWLKKLNKKKLERVTIAGLVEYPGIAEDCFAQAETCLIEMEQKKLLTESVEQLGEGCRNLLRLSWTGKPMEEVAAILKISYGYARKRKTLCMAKLVAIVKQSPIFQHLKW
jgi:RNA polymerase sigma factor (sigma-70 family)